MKMVSKVPKFRAIILVYDTRSTYSLKISDILPLYSPAISLRMRIGPVIIPVPVLEIHSVTYLPRDLDSQQFFSLRETNLTSSSFADKNTNRTIFSLRSSKIVERRIGRH